jgi:hypothetical protein
MSDVASDTLIMSGGRAQALKVLVAAVCGTDVDVLCWRSLNGN